MTALVSELLGPHPTVGELAQTIVERAAGNPFFAEEIVRDLAERGVLHGEPGAYRSTVEAAEVNVPATLQATIAARIDRLDPKAKRTLSAAAVVGSRFGIDLLTALGVEPAVADLVAAWANWERARRVADALTPDDADRTAMRIAARAVLCANAFRVHVDISGGLFEELRQLCAAAGDKTSLAIGMAGLVEVHMSYGRMGEASRLAAETMALVESIGDPRLTIRLSMSPIAAKLQCGEVTEALRWSQTVIDLADSEPAKRNSTIDWPLTAARALALAMRGTARCALGEPGWRSDLDQAVAEARSIGPLPYGLVIAYSYGLAIGSGVLLADDAALRDIEEALRGAERSSEDLALAFARLTLGLALVHRDSRAARERALAVLGQVRDMCLQGRFYLFVLPGVETWAARQRARRGDRDNAIPLLREAVDDLFHARQLWSCIGATDFLVETLLERGAGGDIAEADAAIDRLAAAPTDDGLVIRDIWLLRLRALLAQAHGDDTAYHDYRDRYRAMATSLGFEGHMEWAEAML